jgi:hypothetical protein
MTMFPEPSLCSFSGNGATRVGFLGFQRLAFRAPLTYVPRFPLTLHATGSLKLFAMRRYAQAAGACVNIIIRMLEWHAAPNPQSKTMDGRTFGQRSLASNIVVDTSTSSHPLSVGVAGRRLYVSFFILLRTYPHARCRALPLLRAFRARGMISGGQSKPNESRLPSMELPE